MRRQGMYISIGQGHLFKALPEPGGRVPPKYKDPLRFHLAKAPPPLAGHKDRGRGVPVPVPVQEHTVRR